MVAVNGAICASGLIVTVTVKVAPGPQDVLGVTIYVTVCCWLVGLDSVAEIDPPVPFEAPLSPPVGLVAVQLNVVPKAITPSITCVGVMVNGTPSQKILVIAFT